MPTSQLGKLSFIFVDLFCLYNYIKILINLKFSSSDARLNEVFDFYISSGNAQFNYCTAIEIDKNHATI